MDECSEAEMTFQITQGYKQRRGLTDVSGSPVIGPYMIRNSDRKLGLRCCWG